MKILFNKYEYGDNFEITSIRYTTYDGYGKKTEVEVSIKIDDEIRNKQYVLDGHLSIDRIVDEIIGASYYDLITSYEEDEEEIVEGIPF